ncbi:signal recognition particle protein [bacterium]|nr:signal recognition particle protein [bacterium]
MFDDLQKRLGTALSKVRGRSRISEEDVKAVLAEVRTGLLEADVHFRVAKDFLARVKESCLREEVLKSLSPEQQILKILNDELVHILGSENRELSLDAAPPAVILMCGLQGSGKTTTSVKLGLHLKNKGKRVAVVSVDTQRPAAIEQLAQLSKKYEVPNLRYEANVGAVEIAKLAKKDAHKQNFEVLIVDTAGRLQVDEELMKELQEINRVTGAVERLLVVDSMMGQQAVEVAESFDRDMEITGSVLTKLDGDSRGGAALSIVTTTGRPIKFIGTGERVQDLEPFYPDRMASRLLDMGDVLTLIDKAQEVISEDEAREAAEKMQNMGQFTLEDFRKQMKMISKMGPIGNLMKMMPGMGQMSEALNQVDAEKEMKRANAIIDSMTLHERKNPDVLNGSRRARIASGSGNQVQDVNQFIKRFLDARKMMKNMGKLSKMFGGGSGGNSGNPFGGGGNPFGGAGRRGGGKGFGRKF